MAPSPGENEVIPLRYSPYYQLPNVAGRTGYKNTLHGLPLRFGQYSVLYQFILNYGITTMVVCLSGENPGEGCPE
jgi:hypothetical protein